MTTTHELAERFMAAMAANDSAGYEALLAEEAGLRLYGPDASEVYRPRWRVIARLQAEWSAWSDPRLETLTITANPERAVVEYRLQATDPHSGRYVEYSRVVVLTVGAERVQMIDLYAAAPLPCAPRGDWAAPATLSEAQLDDLIEGSRFAYDLRVFMPLDFRASHSLRGFEGGSDDAHPASNALGGARWTEAEADARIEDILERHRAKQLGFTWWVAPGDTPADLGARLERHGIVFAGEAAKMVRIGLDDLDTIPINPRVTIERLDGTDEAAEAAAWMIIEVCFSWPPEMIARGRAEDRLRYQNPRLRREEFNYLARLDGQPVGAARLILRAGAAYLGGAATLPEFRGQRVYSTLLRHRLEVAREHGYHVSLIDAEPMSRRVVVRYRFVERGKTRIYGWMPVIDLDVIRSLVPQD